MTVTLFGQLSVEKVKELTSNLYNCPTDSDESCVYCLDFVGLIDSFDDVRGYMPFFFLSKLFNIFLIFKVDFSSEETNRFFPTPTYSL